LRSYTLTCISTDGMRDDPHKGEIVESVHLESRECTTVPEMVDLFNKMLAVMGFIAVVDVVEDDR